MSGAFSTASILLYRYKLVRRTAFVSPFAIYSPQCETSITNPDEVEPENAQAVINSQCSILGKAMHQAAYAGQSRDGNIRRGHWWSNDCMTYRNRTRLYFNIWKCMGRPRVGQSYECYKSARKQYRNACRLASNVTRYKIQINLLATS